MLNPKSDRKLRFAAGAIDCQVEQLIDEQADVIYGGSEHRNIRTRLDDLGRIYMDIMMNDDVHRSLNVTEERIRWIEARYPDDPLTQQRVNDLRHIVEILDGTDDGPDDYYGSGGYADRHGLEQ